MMIKWEGENACKEGPESYIWGWALLT